MFWTTLVAFIGARLGFVVLHLSVFSSNWLRVPAIWIAPGMSLYSGLVAAAICSLLMARKVNVRLGIVADAWAMSILPALTIGMLGGFLDGSMVGKPTTAPWALWYVGTLGRRHPVELYFALATFIIHMVLLRVESLTIEKGKAAGTVAVMSAMLLCISYGLLELFVDHPIYWKGLIANQLVLILVFSQAVGGFFVLSGYHRVTASRFQQLHTRIHSIGGGWYEHITAKFPFKRKKNT
jgi:phosphatidylglycerol:prolipoprotein diacylglycerol transferase